MDKLLGSLKGILKIPTIVTDNAIFRLHYQVTALLLIAFSILITSKQHIGDPIDCISKDDIPTELLDTFCWIHSTFSVEEAWFKKVGEEIPYPGVDKYVPGQKKVYHAYYQWVAFVLFLQAILFYLPRRIWKCYESGKMAHLVQDLHNPVLCQDKKDTDKNFLANYFLASFNTHTGYSATFFLCEVLNAVNVIGQMYLMDAFLGGEFSAFGSQVIRFSEWDWSLRYDPMIRVFPRLTKCTFHKYGSSGDVQKHDAMCILPINILNEKIYIFLWFWFVILAVLTCAAVAYRFALYFNPQLRYKSLATGSTLAKKEQIKTILKKCNVGDWFLLELLSRNLNSLHYRDLIEELAFRLEGKHYNGL